MAVTVVPDMTILYDAESDSGWSGGTLYSGFQREGNYCLGGQVSQGTAHFYKTISATDLTNTHIYSWMQLWGSPTTKAEGGFRIVVGDGTNRVAYFVGGSDDYGFQVGAWSCFVLNTANPPTDFEVLAGSESALDWSAITEIGVGFNASNKALGNVDNCFWDICWYGNGLIIKGGTASDPGTFDQIAAEDASTAAGKAYGIIRKIQTGVYGVQGQLTFGDSSGTSDTYFADTNAIIVFEDRAVDANHYKILVVGNSTGTNSFVLGTKSGDAGIQGCVIKSAGSVKFTFDASDANVNEFKLYGCTFLDAGTITLPANATDKEVVTCTFDSCAEILADTCVVDQCNFINADDRGIRMSSTSHNITNSNFISCGHGVNISVTGTFTFDNLQFSGNTYDIENSSGGDVVVNAINGSNPSTCENTAGGSTTINNSVLLEVYVVDEDNNPIQNAQVYIEKADDQTVLMNELTDANGYASETYNYTGDVDINIRIRKSSPGDTRYLPISTTGTITSSGFTLTAVMIEDTIAQS